MKIQSKLNKQVKRRNVKQLHVISITQPHMGHWLKCDKITCICVYNVCIHLGVQKSKINIFSLVEFSRCWIFSCKINAHCCRKIPGWLISRDVSVCGKTMALSWPKTQPQYSSQSILFRQHGLTFAMLN